MRLTVGPLNIYARTRQTDYQNDASVACGGCAGLGGSCLIIYLNIIKVNVNKLPSFETYKLKIINVNKQKRTQDHHLNNIFREIVSRFCNNILRQINNCELSIFLLYSQLLIIIKMRIRLKTSSVILRNCICPRPVSYFCSAHVIKLFKKERARMMLDNSYEAYKRYTEFNKAAQKQLGVDYQHALLKEGITPPVPGLIYIKQFATKQELQELLSNSISLYQALTMKQKQSTHTHKSYNHNLSSDKHYKLLNILDPSSLSSSRLDSQMFVDYGSKNHDLIYFIDNKNIPNFIHRLLISKLKQLPVSQTLAQQNQELNWRLTFNVYKHNSEEETAFLWHKDIAVNGIFTSITSVLGSGYFEIKDEKDERVQYRMLMVPGSLVVLSGESRWRWVHRVLRKQQPIKSERNNGRIQRVSLVLGCK